MPSLQLYVAGVVIFSAACEVGLEFGMAGGLACALQPGRTLVLRETCQGQADHAALCQESQQGHIAWPRPCSVLLPRSDFLPVSQDSGTSPSARPAVWLPVGQPVVVTGPDHREKVPAYNSLAWV